MSMTRLTNNKKVVVCMIAYRAEKTVEKTYRAIPMDYVDEVILCDDGGGDRTAEISRGLGIKTFVHEVNRGYGANQKTCYNAALKDGADIIVMLHADYQYDPTLIPQMVAPIAEGKADATFGSRMAVKRNALKGGMPLWKFIPNIALTFVEGLVFRLGLSEYHTGYRAYSRKVLETIPFNANSDGFMFDAEVFPQLRIGKFRVAEVAIPTRYFKEASSVNFKSSVKYGLNSLRVVAKYLLYKLGIRKFLIFEMQRGS